MNLVPASTYRLQITADFDLDAATRTLPYLHDLGVDWVYLSPLLEAEPGSSHGYDVVAHDRVDASRGGPEGLARLSAAAHDLGMGVLVDIVPNHVGIATPAANAWWWDVLRLGPESPYATYFDIDWAAGGGKILVPVVGEGDEGAIEVGDGEITYHDQRFPMAPGTSSHEQQHYALVDWRRGDRELNYRRFFTVTTLAGLRVEDPAVFAETHVEIRRWFAEGLVDGLRIDHPDGLRDPEGYLSDLAELTGGAYTLVEKILEPGEELDESWSTEGTTGYDALGQIDRLLTDRTGEARLVALEEELRGSAIDWDELVHGTKRAVADGALAAEVARIVRELEESNSPGSRRIFSTTGAGATRDAVAELLACFPVYRSYLPEGRKHLDKAFADARDRRPDLAATFEQLEPLLSDPEEPASLRFQQTSGMVMAKGVEDCAFYRYARLTSLNEVGGDPHDLALEPLHFHGWAARRQHEWPEAMTATSTHDTKRGEDTRARIMTLAEVPDVWAATIGALLAAIPLPDPVFGVLLWQAVLGVWSDDPDLRDRLHAYAEKAMREAGDHTTWTDPDEGYEAQVHAAVDAVFDNPDVSAQLTTLLDRVRAAGDANALSQKVLALMIPGVPDVYQGSEIEDRSLVDPDNRRPVDFGSAADSLSEGGSAKQMLTAAALRLRRDRPELFSAYEPLTAEGPASEHLVAFDRGGAIAAVTRLPIGLQESGGWGETLLRLPSGRFADQVSGVVHEGTVRAADLFADSPAVVLAVPPGER